MQSMLAHHRLPSHPHNRDPPSNHHARRDAQATPPAVGGAEVNPVGADLSPSHCEGRASSNERVGGQEIAGDAVDQATPVRSVERERQRPSPGAGRQWWHTPSALASPRQRQPPALRQQAERMVRQRESPNQEYRPSRQVEQREQRELTPMAHEPASQPEQTEGERPREARVWGDEGFQRLLSRSSERAVAGASSPWSPFRAQTGVFRAHLTQRQRALANTRALQQSPSQGRGVRGRGQVTATKIGGGPENGYQAAGRRALTSLEVANPEANDPDEIADPTYREEQLPLSESDGEDNLAPGVTQLGEQRRAVDEPGAAGGPAGMVRRTRFPTTTRNEEHSRNRGNRAARSDQAVPNLPQIPRYFSPDDLAKRGDLFDAVANWDITALRDSRQPSLSRRLPPNLCQLFSLALLTPLLHLSRNPDSVAGWRLLLFLPRLTLRQSSPRRPNWSTVKAWLRSFQCGEWEQLHANATKAVNTPPPPRHQPDDTGTVSRAEGLAKRGSLRRAVLALESTPVCTPCPAILHQLREKHPPADNEELTWPRASTPNLTITHADFVKLLSRCENGVGAGPSGTTFEHLRDASMTNATVCTHLHALVNTLLAGNLPGPVADLLTASRLIALSKPGGGARPIAIGECMTRLAAKAALTVMGESARDQFLPLQYGVAVPGGAEAIIHAARSFTDSRPQCLVLQTDIANAFNSISRQAIIEAIQDNKLSPLLPLVKLTYGNPSQLLLDANFDSPPLSSERGVRQGDPLGPLLFAAGIHPALRETATAHPEVLCLAYADDVTFMGEQEHAVAAFTFFTDKLAHLGLAHNPEKCAAWSSATVETSQLPPEVPFSKEGVRLLGSYLGPAIGAANFLAGQLEEMAKPLPLLERADPQVASLLLTRCISRRVAYITRTTPLNLLSRNTWSQWGSDLLATLLTSCGIRVPSCNTEH
ncbi:unnamed protein product [Closterium sp. NIES-54]